MKRLTSSSDSLDDQHQQGNVYSREFQSMLDGLDSDGCVDESSHINEKKRRLSLHQVKALEKYFEVENKLEPERKVKLAQELGLQPRQVAVWFQNRRARWKTKQLERDYNVLKSNYDNLKINFDSLQRDKDSLLKEIRDLKAKLNNETPEQSNDQSAKEEDGDEEEDEDAEEEDDEEEIELFVTEQAMNAAAEALNDSTNVVSLFPVGFTGTSSTDSASSAILNDSKGSPNGAVSTNGVVTQNLVLSRSAEYHPEFVKMEEESLFGGDESCDFFSEEQAPTLHWYCPDQWT